MAKRRVTVILKFSCPMDMEPSVKEKVERGSNTCMLACDIMHLGADWFHLVVDIRL